MMSINRYLMYKYVEFVGIFLMLCAHMSRLLLDRVLHLVITKVTPF